MSGSINCARPAKRLGDMARRRIWRCSQQRQSLLLPVTAGMWQQTRDRLLSPRISKIFFSQLTTVAARRIRLLGFEFCACFFFPPSKPVASQCQKRASGRRILALIRPRCWPGGGAKKSPALSASLGCIRCMRP